MNIYDSKTNRHLLYFFTNINIFIYDIRNKNIIVKKPINEFYNNLQWTISSNIRWLNHLKKIIIYNIN